MLTRAFFRQQGPSIEPKVILASFLSLFQGASVLVPCVVMTGQRGRRDGRGTRKILFLSEDI